MNPENDPLAQLRDIQLPISPEFWPPAPGWWLLAFVGVVAIILMWRAWRRRVRRNQPLRDFVRQLKRIEPGDDVTARHDALQQMSALLRRYAIARFGRNNVAGLHGEAWLDFLQQSGDSGTSFSQAPGSLIASAPYQPASSIDIDALREILILWAKAGPAGTVRC